MKVEIVYAMPEKQTVLSCDVAAGTTVEAAIKQSELLSIHPEIDLQAQSVGIFSEKVSLAHVVKDGDRVEIYRALIQDPKARRMKKVMK